MGAWHHVAATYDGTTRRLYLDGVLVNSDTPTGHNVPNTNNLRLGSAYGGTFYPGSLDEVRVWSRPLTAAEIATSANRLNPANLLGLVSRWAMEEGSGLTVNDSQGNSPAGTLTNGPTFTQPGVDYAGVVVKLTVNDGSGSTSVAYATVTNRFAATAQDVTATLNATTGRAYVAPVGHQHEPELLQPDHGGLVGVVVRLRHEQRRAGFRRHQRLPEPAQRPDGGSPQLHV